LANPEPNLPNGSHQRPSLIRAAQYVRMSTEHQRYSTENQADAIRRYAAERGIEIVRTYADEGKSGLKIKGRKALKQLIADVQEGRPDFQTILVYDVSRWGRFQDADESAYYEYVCKRSGIAVEYCAEQFENDGSSISTIVKNLKRAMAGEYSRDLSTKVFAGHRRLIELGFRQGGVAGYGLRRQLIDDRNTIKAVMASGERKSLQTDRVVLIPGPPNEVETIRWIFRSFVAEGRTEKEIASLLNARGINPDLNRPWRAARVHAILINEKYVGNNVWNRSSAKLKGKYVRNRPERYIRANGAFEPIVERALFEAAQGIIRERARHLSNDEMLGLLRRVLAEKGYLSAAIINKTRGVPTSTTYRRRFGNLGRVYELLGYVKNCRVRYISRGFRPLHADLMARMIAGVKCAGGQVKLDPLTQVATINAEFTAAILIARCQKGVFGSPRWQVRLDKKLPTDISIVVRMDPDNKAPQDYYLLPRADVGLRRISFAQHNDNALDRYRSESLQALFKMTARVPVKEALDAKS
jgi:DNA invertase Pin-like site-specific DNA recombinase